MRWLLFEHLYNRKIYFSQFVIEMSVYFTFNQKNNTVLCMQHYVRLLKI